MAQKPLQHLYLALALLLTAGITASCADDLTDGSTTGTPIAFDAPRATETRAAVEGDFRDGSAFSVWGWYGTGNTINNNVFEGVTVTNNNGTWTYNDGFRYWIAGMTYNFYGVYPEDVTATVSAEGNITITDFDCSKTGENAVDLMTAAKTNITYEENDTPQPVDFTFGHLLARVKFTVTSEGDEVTINSAKVYGVNYKGTWTESSSTWANPTVCDDSNTPFKKENIPLTTSALSTELFGDLLLLPHEKLDGATLALQYQYTGKTEEKTVTLPLSSGTVSAWSANTSYHYQVTIPKDAIDVTMTVTVNDWEVEDVTVEW